jgi:hypothetical protein
MNTDIRNEHWSIHEWQNQIDELLEVPDQPHALFNINEDDAREYDAIFLGGGAGGRSGRDSAER